VPHLVVNGARLYYEEHGEGEPILCIHGTGSCALVWEDAVGRLAREGRPIAYDRRGCTRSERPEPYEETTVAEHGDDAAALLEALGATPATVIGRSYGGEVAIDLALRHPEHVRALALLEPFVPRISADADAWHAELLEQLEAAGDPGKTLIEAALGPGAWGAFPQELRDMFSGNGPAILAETRRELEQADPSALATAGVPVLLVSASDSPPVLREVMDGLARAIPHAERVRVPGGHMIDPASPEVLAFVHRENAPGG
jgi:esterase